jgi:hypothetical protein
MYKFSHVSDIPSINGRADPINTIKAYVRRMEAMLSGCLVTTAWQVMASRYGRYLPIQE